MTYVLEPKIKSNQHDAAMAPVNGNKWLGHPSAVDEVDYVFNQLQVKRNRLPGLPNLPNPRSAELHHHIQEKKSTCDRRHTEASSETL